MLPLMMIELLGSFYGLPGLFLAAVCCASLRYLWRFAFRCQRSLIPNYRWRYNTPVYHLFILVLTWLFDVCSSMSSGQTAIATCLIKDFIEPIYGKIQNIQDYRLPDKSATLMGKIMGTWMFKSLEYLNGSHCQHYAYISNYVNVFVS